MLEKVWRKRNPLTLLVGKGFELDLKMSMIEIVGFPGGAVIKNLSTNTGDTRDTGSIPRPERSPGGWHSNPLQYSCLENPMDRGD